MCNLNKKNRSINNVSLYLYGLILIFTKGKPTSSNSKSRWETGEKILAALIHSEN